MSTDTLLEYLKIAPEIAELCTQIGWIDNETIRYDIIERRGDQLLLAVEFEEIIMEGAGCVADRKPCYGRVRVSRDSDGSFQYLKLILNARLSNNYAKDCVPL